MQNLTCIAYGVYGKDITYLKWYKEINDGLSAIDKPQIVKEKRLTNDYRYKEYAILKFNNFDSSNEGKYVCQRQIGTFAASFV